MTKVARIETHRIETHRATIAPARAEPELSLVPTATPGQRARQLVAEARAISLEHLAALQAAIAVTRDLAQEVVDAGDLYAPGLQHFARRFAEELFWRGKSLEALMQRQGAAPRREPGRAAP